MANLGKHIFLVSSTSSAESRPIMAAGGGYELAPG